MSVALGIAQEFMIVDDRPQVVELIRWAVCKVAGYYYLVKKIPLAFICQCAYAIVKHLPERIEEFVVAYAFAFFEAPSTFAHDLF